MQDTKVKTKALDKGNCAAARPGGKEAGVKATSPRTETGSEAGDADKFAPQNEVHEVSASQVKPFDKLTAGPGLCCESHVPYPGRPVRRAVGRASGPAAPAPAMAPVGGQESAEVVVTRETSRE